MLLFALELPQRCPDFHKLCSGTAAPLCERSRVRAWRMRRRASGGDGLMRTSIYASGHKWGDARTSIYASGHQWGDAQVYLCMCVSTLKAGMCWVALPGKVGIYSSNTREWMITMQACNQCSIVCGELAPVLESTPPPSLKPT
jgi:hypothetical protein